MNVGYEPLSEWKDLDSIKKFAGNDYEKTKYYPEDEIYLLAFTEKVIHYQTYTFSDKL